jgi:hypothetical protein
MAEEEPPIHPVTGLPVTDPYEALCIRQGAYAIYHEKVFFYPWRVLIRPEQKEVQYHGLTLPEAILWQKLASEAMCEMRDVMEAVGIKGRHRLRTWLEQMKIPMYLIAGKYLVFSGDVVRAVAACEIPTAGAMGVAWRETFKYRDKAHAGVAAKGRRLHRKDLIEAARDADEGGPGQAEGASPVGSDEGTLGSGPEGRGESGATGSTRREREGQRRDGGQDRELGRSEDGRPAGSDP